MKTKLYAIAAVLCLLTVLVSSTSCTHLAMSLQRQAAMHQQAATDECPMHAPQSKSIPSCCSATHQTPTAITTAILQQPIFLTAALAPLPADQVTPRLSILPTQLTGPPPLLPHITLRI